MRLVSMVLSLSVCVLLAGCVAALQPRPGAIEGVVVDPSDHPLANATVLIEGRPDLADVTSADGVFGFDGIPAGPVVLVVEHPEYRTTKTPVLVPVGRPVQSRLLAGADIFEGFENGLGSFAPQNSTRVPAEQSDDRAYAGLYSMKTYPGTWQQFKFATPMSGHLTLYFYDDLSEQNKQVVEMKVSGGTFSSTASHLVGIATHVPEGQRGNYIGRHWWVGHARWLWIDTGIPRTEGWHRVEFAVDDMGTTVYLDGQEIFNTPYGENFLEVSIGNPWAATGDGIGWWDQFVFAQNE